MKTFNAKHIAYAATRIEELARFGKRTLPDSVKKMYVEFLAPLTPEELDLCLKAWVFKSTRFPSAEELLACCGRSPSQKAETNWLTIDLKRDQIADEVCRQNQILSSLRLCGHGSEYEAGIARRELKKRFCELYEVEWFKWWVSGNIEAGESILDFTPTPVVQVQIKPEDRLSKEDTAFLKKRIADISKGKGIGRGKAPRLTPDQVKAIEETLSEDPSKEDETLPAQPESAYPEFDDKDFPDDIAF